jgi:glycosyltransferase involved in cell wall biosynthesis
VARSSGVPVVYDTDDLIWDQRLTEYCALDEHYSPHEVKEFQALFRRTDALMREADVFVASTQYLADAIHAWFGRPAFVSQNAISLQAVRLSETIYRHRIDAAPSDLIRIAYFSGWPKAHEGDFAVAVPAITRALAELPSARLRIVGHFDDTRLPASLRRQVESAPFVPWDRLFASIGHVDINLAPIIDNPHRRAKSAVKFLEAALVGTPTVASDLEPYQTIAHGQTGYLARDATDWYTGIMALATSSEHRRQVGQAARDYVLRYHTTEARAASFEALLRGIVQRNVPGTEVDPSR